MLDEALATIAAAPAPQPVSHWLSWFAERSHALEEAAFARLVARGILRREDKKILWVFGVRRYPTIDNQERTEVRTRLAALIRGDDLPDPRDAVLIGLLTASHLIYSLFPEPDLVPVAIDRQMLDAAAADMPELPSARAQRFQDELGLAPDSAQLLAFRVELGDYFEAALAAGADPAPPPQALANWVTGELLGRLDDLDDPAASNVQAGALAALVGMLDAKQVNAGAARQVLDNLILNACEGNGQNRASAVEVGVQRDPSGAGVVIEVADDGPGFAESLLTEPIEGFATSKKNGTGLGLYTSERLVRASGGTLERTNRAGGGACVRVTLPLQQ